MHEQLNEAGQFINQFGFPIFFGVISIVFMYLLFRYFTTTIEKKDCDFLAYTIKRDDQMTDVVKGTNESMNAFSINLRENTLATHGLRKSVDFRNVASGKLSESIDKQTELLDHVNEKL